MNYADQRISGNGSLVWVNHVCVWLLLKRAKIEGKVNYKMESIEETAWMTG